MEFNGLRDGHITLVDKVIFTLQEYGSMTRRQLLIRVGAVEAIKSSKSGQYHSVNATLARLQRDGIVYRKGLCWGLTKRPTL